jgi:hypothetical protein
MKRLDKQKEKAARRAQRKLDKKDNPAGNNSSGIEHIQLGPQAPDPEDEQDDA